MSMMHRQANIRNEINLLIKYIKSLLWRVAKCLSYIEEAWCLKVKHKIKYTRGTGSTELCTDAPQV